MVLSFLIGFSTVFATSEGIKASQAKSRREEHRSRKNNLVVHCPKGSKYSPLLEGRRVVLSGDKLYVDTGTEYNVPFGHPFTGYYLAYPEQRYSGLVSSITDEAPIMNWIYVHRETYEVKFGPRQLSEGNFTGPWDCTRQDRRMTFGGWEGFFAVKEGDFWSLYFDRDNDRLRSKVPIGTPVIELELIRKEMRTPKPPPPPAPEPNPQQEQGKEGQAGTQPAQEGQEQTQQNQQQPESQAQTQAQTQAQAAQAEPQAQQAQQQAQQQPQQAEQDQQDQNPDQAAEMGKTIDPDTVKSAEKPEEKRKSTVEEELNKIPAPDVD